MENSMVVFTFSIFDRKYLFLDKFVSVSWKLVLRLIQVRRIQWWRSFFLYFWLEGFLFRGNLPEKNENCLLNQQFGSEKDGNRCKFIDSNILIFCCRRSEKPALCKSISQSEVIFIVYCEPIKIGHVEINFSQWQHIQNVNTERTE